MKLNTYYITASTKHKGKFCLYYYCRLFFGIKKSFFVGLFDSIEGAKDHIRLVRNGIIEQDL